MITRSKNAAALWLVWAVMVVAAGCASINPMAAADTAEQRAFAAYGMFVVFSESAADLVESGQLSDNSALRIINAEDDAKTGMDSVVGALEEYNEIRAQIDSGETTADRLDIVVRNLDDWVDNVSPILSSFVSIVREEQ